jgi:hypothetical protein
MSQTITHSLSLKAVDENNLTIYEQTVAATLTQKVTHHGQMTITKASTDELHTFPDIASGEKTLAVFKANKDLTVKVGADTADARTIKANTLTILQDDSLGGAYYFSNADTATDALVEYWVGELE